MAYLVADPSDMMMSTGQQNAHVAIVGAGPRGTSVLERLVAYAPDLITPPEMHLTIHVVDPFPPGPGAVWRVDQPAELLMNTVSSQITLFTDDSVTSAGRISPGPTLHEWLKDRGLGETTVGPDDYPTRAMYGEYLASCFSQSVRAAPGNVTIKVHRTTAVDLEDGVGGLQTLRLADGSQLRSLAVVVLAHGHLPLVPNATETGLASFAAAAAAAAQSTHHHGLRYVPPRNPADVDLSGISSSDTVFLRGLGLCFFDYMALLTSGRGGRFERSRDSGELRYVPSGEEPRMYAASRRGVPYQARGDNEKGAYGRHYSILMTDEVIAGFRRRQLEGKGNLPDFEKEVWPMIRKEVELVYYEALLCLTDADHDNDDKAKEFRTGFLAASSDSPEEAQLLEKYGIVDPSQRWSWERLEKPYTPQNLSTAGEWREWLTAYLKDDVRHARAGNVHGPLKAALDLLRDLRNEVRLIVDHGGLAGASRRDHVDRWYTPLNGYLSIGPPRERIEQMVALMEAGVLTVVGPSPELHCDRDAGQWRVRSLAIPGSEVKGVNVVIEARLPEPDVRRTADELLARLQQRGQCRAHVSGGGGNGGGGYETGGVDVSESPFHLVDCQGRHHPRRLALGVPTEGVHWVTAAGARPGVNSVTLCDTDAVSRAILASAAKDMRAAATAATTTGEVLTALFHRHFNNNNNNNNDNNNMPPVAVNMASQQAVSM